MATNYVRGRAKEYATIAILEQLGEECIRAASSKGLWDVHASCARHERLVQVKLTKSDFSEDENCRLLRAHEAAPSTLKELWIFVAGKGLQEVRDLRKPPFDARTAEGKAAREVARDRAKGIRAAVKLAKAREKRHEH